MIKKNLIYGFVLLISMITFSSCGSNSNLIGSSQTTNSKKTLKKPYLILISLDGFRWDYIERFAPPHLSNFIKNGVKAESLIPSFPSKTFPNHYTIATGMYPDNHGILGNSFSDIEKKKIYSIRNRATVEDGTFYGGSPIWVQADKSDMVSASYFFVGTEANVMGIRPTYYYQYNDKTGNDVRVNQALNWLELPIKKRPHIITMYFSDMDDAGHKFGPNNNDEIKKALFNLDKNLGNLFKGTKATGLPINFIIVSDHGMSDITKTNYIPIDVIKNENLYSLIDNGAIVNIHPKEDVNIDTIIQYFKSKESNYKVYKTENTPGFEYRPKNKNWGPVQIIPDFGYYFLSSAGIKFKMNIPNTTFGVHGYDPKYKDMHGIFYANGPAFKKGNTIPSIKNIHIYPLMCKILGLEIPNDIDGNLNQIKNVLKTD